MIDFQSQLYLTEDPLLEELIDEGVISPNVEVLTSYLVISVGALFFSLLLDIYANGEGEDEDDEDSSGKLVVRSFESNNIQNGSGCGNEAESFHKQFKWRSRNRDTMQLQKPKAINHSESNENGTRHDCGGGTREGDYRQMKINEGTDPPLRLEQHGNDDSYCRKNGMKFADDNVILLKEKQNLAGEITKGGVEVS